MKKIIGLGVITGVFVFAFVRSLGGKVDRRLVKHMEKPAQLV